MEQEQPTATFLPLSDNDLSYLNGIEGLLPIDECPAWAHDDFLGPKAIESRNAAIEGGWRFDFYTIRVDDTDYVMEVARAPLTEENQRDGLDDGLANCTLRLLGFQLGADKRHRRIMNMDNSVRSTVQWVTDRGFHTEEQVGDDLRFTKGELDPPNPILALMKSLGINPQSGEAAEDGGEPSNEG